jgi:hypothetical protein
MSAFLRILVFVCYFLGLCNATFLRRREHNITSDLDQSSPNQPAFNNSANHTKDDLFVVIFVSDLETKFRGHNIDRSRYVVRYIRDLKNEQLFFDANYSDHQIKPDMVIHGGDISHLWACNSPSYFFIGGCRTPRDEIIDVWEQLYEAGIPMVSTFGNHDWKPMNGTGNPWAGVPRSMRDSEADQINRQSADFVRRTYEKSAQLGSNFEYTEIEPTGDIGQGMYRATFRGLQLASFNAAFNWQSYDSKGVYSADDQFHRLSKVLDRRKKTIFFSHFPLSKRRLQQQSPSVDAVKSLIREFGSGSHHFSGHYHAALVEEYNDVLPHFNDYVAPYPHHWGGREPGFLAILASKDLGVLQVKTVDIPGIEDGETCFPVNYLNIRNHVHGYIPLFETNFDSIELGCDRCKAGRHSWCSSRGWYICGTKLCPK